MIARRHRLWHRVVGVGEQGKLARAALVLALLGVAVESPRWRWSFWIAACASALVDAVFFLRQQRSVSLSRMTDSERRMARLAREQLGLQRVIGREHIALASIVATDEVVHFVARCDKGRQHGLVAVTDRRILLVREASVDTEIELDHVAGVEKTSDRMGWAQLVVTSTTGDVVELGGITPAARADDIVTWVRARENHRREARGGSADE